MFVRCFLLLVCFLAAAKGSITQWASDVTEWKIDDLEDGACKTDLQAYVDAFSNLLAEENLWALQMLDSSAKLPNGLLSLSLVHIGMFEECLAVKHPTGRFQGKHCMLSIPLTTAAVYGQTLPVIPKFLENYHSRRIKPRTADPELAGLAFKYGLCIPSTCSASDLNQILGDFSSRVIADDANCSINEKKPLSDLAIAFICVSTVLAALTAISTCYHYLCIHKNQKPKQLFCAFSLRHNVPKLLEIRSNDGDNMGCLHGIRTMSMMWVVLCHTYDVLTTGPYINTIDLNNVMNDMDHIIIANGFASVDSFFFMSGLLVAFVFFRNIGKSGTYDAISSYIHRYIRLTPPLAMMIFATASIIPEIGRGPLWHDAWSAQIDSCKKDWWRTIIYVENYVPPEHSCLGPSWYLSDDMQMFWIAPLILYPILLWPTYGMIFLGFLSVASTAWTFAIAYVNGFKANILLALFSEDQMKEDYWPAHTRIMPWLVGVACGVGICAIKARKIPVRLSTPWVLAGWCASTAACLGILFSIHRFQIDPEASDLENALFLSLTRLGWGLGLAWIVFACIHGYGGIINSFLSLGVWQPLGKLSYSVFLIHMTIFYYKVSTYQTNILLSDLTAVYDFSETLLLSYLISLVLYLTVEAPFVIMDQEFFGSVKILPYPKPKPKKARLEEVEEAIEGQDQESLSTEKLHT